MIPWEDHRARLLDAVSPLPAQDVPLQDALGLVAAADVRTRHPVPLFDNSAMDGYAVHGAEATEGARLSVVADVPAGSPLDPDLGPGEAARIMTGAAAPTQADAVVPQENVETGPEGADGLPAWIRILTPPKPGAHLRRRGEDSRAGSVAVPAGADLTPWAISAVASAGYTEVPAVRRPRVAVVSTGSELISPDVEPERGQIPESNSVLLRAVLTADRYEVADVAWFKDSDGDALAAHLTGLDVDAVIVTGGASVGAYDVAKHALTPLGVRFEKVGVQPGKPQGFGILPTGVPAFCLPGNPVAVAVSYEMFVRPALRRMGGHTELLRPLLTRRARVDWKCPPGRAQVLPAVMDATTVAPATAGGSGSHLVVSLAAARQLAIVPAHVERVREGDEISVMVLS